LTSSSTTSAFRARGLRADRILPVLAIRTWKKRVIARSPHVGRDELRIVDLNNGGILYPNPKLPGEGRCLRARFTCAVRRSCPVTTRSRSSPPGCCATAGSHPGDIGMFTYNDCLKIVGRWQGDDRPAQGENIEPVPIENRLCESAYIDNCMVVGQDQKHLAALIVYQPRELQGRWRDRHDD